MIQPAPTTVAEIVIARFGGVNAMARRLSKTASTVQGWKDSGAIPLKNWPEIERIALEENMFDLTARWLGEAHAAQEVNRARIANDVGKKGDDTLKAEVAS